MGGAKFGHEISPETRAKISASLTGRKPPPSKLRGRKQPAEVIQKRADAQRKYAPTCVIDGCNKPHLSRGWCASHYSRWRNRGTTDDPPPLVGELARKWSGDEVGYTGIHIRAKKVLPKVCAVCGTTGPPRLEAALRHDAKPTNLRTHTYIKRGENGGAQATLIYSVRVTDYVRLCRKCHRLYDSPLKAKSAPIIEALTLMSPYTG